MSLLKSKRPSFCLCIGFAILTALLMGCHMQNAPPAEKEKPLPRFDKMVVMGFKPVSTNKDHGTPTIGSISGAVYESGAVSLEVADDLSQYLLDKIIENESFDIVSPAQAMGVYSSLISSDTVFSEIEITKRIGRAFSADVVLTGYIYRWKEREGTDYSADKAASVAFDLYLIRPLDGATLWWGRFDKTQHSLTHNLLDTDLFVRSGGKWLVAQRLAELGVDSLLAQILKNQGEKANP